MASVVQTELVQDLVELVMKGHCQGALNHVGTQINPLLVVLFDHIKDHLFSISLTRVDVGGELLPWDKLRGRGGREAILFIVVKVELISIARFTRYHRFLFLDDQRLLAIAIEAVLVRDLVEIG